MDAEEQSQPSRNIGLELVRVTEATAVAAGRWIGSGKREEAHQAATEAMYRALCDVEIDGRIVIGEEGRRGEVSPLDGGQTVGSGRGASVDVVVDPIDGTGLLIKGHPGAIALVSVAPRGAMFAPSPAVYMEKIIVDVEAAHALVPECLDAPAAWTLALVARVKKKPVRDLTVIVLDRPRHGHLIEEIRATGARILLRGEGDAEGALVAATPGTGVDMLIGIGGAPEGVIAACAVKAMNGAMIARLAPQTDEERTAVIEGGVDPDRILTVEELVRGNQTFFAATGITGSVLLSSLQYHGDIAQTHSLLLRAETRTRRFIRAEFFAGEDGERKKKEGTPAKKPDTGSPQQPLTPTGL